MLTHPIYVCTLISKVNEQTNRERESMNHALYIEHLPTRNDAFQKFFQTKESARHYALARPPVLPPCDSRRARAFDVSALRRKPSSSQYRYRLDTYEPDFEHFYLVDGTWDLA